MEHEVEPTCTAPLRDDHKDFATLLNLMTALIEKVAGTEIREGQAWLNDAQILATKLLKQACSLKVLVNRTSIHLPGNAVISFIDHSSAIILARACIETFIAYHWIFNSQDRKQMEFRHGVWRLGGLMDRLGLHPSTAEAREVMAKTQAQVDSLLPTLEISPYLSEYSSKQVKQLLAGNWRVGWSWAEEAERAGFNRQYFENVYDHFCGYAHSSYISSMQIGEAQDEADQLMLANSALQACVHVMAMFINHHAILFPEAGEALQHAPQGQKRTLDRWSFTAADMSHLYDK